MTFILGIGILSPMSDLVQTEAIVLHLLPFKEYDRILTLFSPHGLLKLFVKSSKKNYLHCAALTSPFTRAEFYYKTGRKDLHTLIEGTLLQQHFRIRDRYETIQAAEKMTQALLASQWPGKPAPQLYTLLFLFLERLPVIKNPHAFSTTFLLKILRHEGVLELPSPLTKTYRFAGESYSHSPPPLGALPFDLEEEMLLAHLALSRSLTDLDKAEVGSEFEKKIDALFNQAFH